MDNAHAATIKSRIVLGREPCSAGALTLVEAVMQRIEPAMQGGRVLGAKGRAGLRSHLGTILAGIMRPSGGVRAPRGHAAGLWRNTDVIGPDRFWRITDALISVGLIGHRKGIRGNSRGEAKQGSAAVLWSQPDLVALAAGHGVIPETRVNDWGLSDAAANSTKPRGVRVEPWMLRGNQGEKARQSG